MLLSAGEIISKSWQNYVKCWRKFVPYMILLYVPTVVLSALGVISLYLSAYLPESTLASGIVIVLVFLATLVFALWTSIALAKALRNCVVGQEQNWKTLFSESSSHIWPVIYTSLLVSLIVLGGFILLIIPGIIFSVWYSFVFYGVVFEDKKGLVGLRASKDLVVGRWWAILWRLFAPGLVFGLLTGIINAVIGFIINSVGLSQLNSILLSNIFTSLVSVIVSPLTAMATVLLYLSAKESRQTQAPTPQPQVNQ